MKIMLLGLALLTTSAFACERPEAQFIGKAKNVTADCTYQVEFTQFNSSMVCPLDDIEASAAVLKDSSCTIKNGDVVSGYLAKINEEIVLD